MVYTMKEQHATNIRAIRETWASHCDGFLAFSTADDPRLPAISLPHAGKEEYNNMWQKVRSIWKFVGTNYLEEFDFFFQGGEDLFVIPQNLKRYLKDLMDQDGKNSDDDFFVGRRFKGYDKDNYFNSGGAGYALSRGTLRKYITEGWEHPSCDAKTHSAMEDVMIARCLRNVFGIGLTDTRDSSLRERFHPFAPASHFFWRPPTEGNKDWYQDYNEEWPPLLGEQCCAPDSVSFHYIKKPAMVRHLHAILNSCPRPTVPRVLDANGSDDNEDGDDGNGSSDGDGDDGDGDDQNDGAD
jgi:glycoprotein-N-acetylgalactosamine 3-beta-galactosyltransferase